MVFRTCMHGLIAAAALVVAVAPGRAQSVAEFYKGKTVDLYIGYSVGGAYDLYARMIARHLGKHIPGNPTVLSKNMEGAGSLRLANWLYNVAPKDGSAMGIIGRGTGFDPLLGGTSSSADTDQFPKIVNGVLGTKMKVVTGYPGGNEVGLAMERGEVQGRCGW